jgi:hypothetical protein
MLVRHRNSNGLRQQILRMVYLQQHLIPLAAFRRRLLLVLISGHLLVQEAGALTATDGVEPVDTKILSDEITVGLELCDQAPLAEALSSDQQNK